jgi:hypothetical protein
VERFGYSSGRQVTVERIEEVEKELGVVLPKAYLEFLCQYGCVGVKTEMALKYDGPCRPDLDGFFVFEHVVEVVRTGWNTIIPAGVIGAESDVEANVFEYFIPIAEAECGNYFLFRRTSAAADDLPVHVFDHEIEPNFAVVAESFDELLWWYVENVREN